MTEEGQGGNAVAGKQVTFGYDIAHQMTDIHRFATSPSSSELVAHSLYDYDLAGRVTSITHSREEVSAPWDGSTFHDDPETVTDTIAAYFLNYDEGNRLEQFASWRDEFVVDYEYDPRNQLTSATYDNGNGVTALFLPYAQNPTAHKETYNYDGNGNRLDANGDDYETGLDNRLEDDDTFAYQNDDEGNRTRRTRADNSYTEYVWDHRDRLESVVERDAGGVILSQVDYVYDPFDRRIAKLVDADGDQIVDESTAWIYDGQHIALEFTDADGDGPQPEQLSHRYLHGPMVDMILADEHVTSTATEGDVYWPLTDHLYSVRDVIDSEGNVVNHVVYDSFGNRVSESKSVDFLFGYTGRDWDEDVDLQYNRARWYDPAVGRWLSEDPIRFDGDPSNQYRYVENQTTSSTDPSGLRPPVRPTSRPPYSGPYNPYIPGGRYGRNATLPYDHPRVTIDGRLVGRGHSIQQILRAARIRQQQRLNAAQSRIVRRQIAEALRSARAFGRQVGMTEAQIQNLCKQWGNQPLPSAAAIREAAGIAGYTNAIARHLGQQRGVGRDSTIAVIATRDGQGRVTFTVFSNQYNTRGFNYLPPRVKEAIVQMRKHGIPIRTEENIRPGFGPGQPKRGANPHAEEIAEEYALGSPIAIGTSRPHCPRCMARMIQRHPAMIPASQSPQAKTAEAQAAPR